MVSIALLLNYMNDEQKNRVREFLSLHGKDENDRGSCRRFCISGDQMVTVFDVEDVEESIIL